MKKTIVCAVLYLVVLFAACSKDTDDKLDGKWQLQEVTTNNVTEKVDTVFYNFLTTTFMYQIYDKKSDSYSQIYGLKTSLEENKILIEMVPSESIPSFLPRTDWGSPEKTFTIEKITGSRLILNSEGKRYNFRKF